MKTDFDNEVSKNNQLSEQNSHMNVEFGKIRVKLQFTEEKVEKDVHDMRDKKSEMENMSREY